MELEDQTAVKTARWPQWTPDRVAGAIGIVFLGFAITVFMFLTWGVESVFGIGGLCAPSPEDALSESIVLALVVSGPLAVPFAVIGLLRRRRMWNLIAGAIWLATTAMFVVPVAVEIMHRVPAGWCSY